ncbi:MAG: lipid-A-disaccharide synthase [Nitrospirae bacterium]|nr:lipid-A-disaccharide synthase [Nitrospirota bacterium]MBI3351893.1 lipid-A-disaccharide synthase [Nitrospirota bacterium]
MAKNILIVTGEPSGDLHGGKLVQALIKKDPTLKIFAVGGSAIQAAGGDLIFNIESLGVVGLFEVITHLKVIRKAFQTVLETLRKNSIDHLVLIDYPDFNLRVARRAKQMGIPVTYYISPQIWAWRHGRIHLIKQLIDQMLVILPFEETLYRKERIPVAFVGHPLLEEINPVYQKDPLCKKFGLNPSYPIVGICPGSRESELKRLLPVMLEASEKIRTEIPNVQFILPIAAPFSKEKFLKRLGSYAEKIKAVKGDTSEVMAVCDFLTVASGTATLQAAIIGTPMIIVYKVSPLTYWIGKKLLKIKMIGLVNIILGDKIIPELIQHEATAENIKLEIVKLFQNKEKNRIMKSKLSLIKEKLTEKKASENAAEAILRLLYR